MLTITIKDLRQATFAVTIEPTETVAQLKRLIEAERGADEFAASRQCLIYSGRILADERQLSEYQLEEQKFVVLMVKREAMMPAATELKAGRQPAEASSLVSGTAVPEPNMLAIAHIVEMGYTRPEALQAMRLAGNNYEQAIEFLLTGEMPAPEATATTTTPPPNAAAAAAASSAADFTFGANPLAFLRDHPDFRHMQQLVSSDPQSLHAIIQQLETSQPELFRTIVANVPAFVELLTEGMLDDVEFPFAEVASAVPVPVPSTASTGGEEEEVVSVPLTGAERAAVQRLMELGFEEVEAVQAYLAFEKNEQLAAEFLLEMHELGGPED